MASSKYPTYKVKLQPITERKRRKSDLVLMWQSIIDVTWRIFLMFRLICIETWQQARLWIWHDEIDEIKQFLKKYLSQVPDDFSKSWRDGTLLCLLLSKLKPGCIPGVEKLDRNYALRNMYHAFDVLDTKFGIIPEVTAEELVVCVDGSHHKLLEILFQLKKESENRQIVPKIIVETPESENDKLDSDPNLNNCIIKGTGLMIAFVERRANFVIFCSSTTDINLVIEIKGPENTICRERITKRSPKKKLSTIEIGQIKFQSLSRSTSHAERGDSKTELSKLGHTDEKLIPLEYNIYMNQIRVTYIPLVEGQHIISILWHGLHVSDSPFTVIVESPADTNVNTLKQKNTTLKLPNNNEDHGNKERRKAVVQHQESTKDIVRVGKVISRKVLRHIVKIKDKDIVVDTPDLDHLASSLLKMDYEIQADPLKNRRNSWGFTGDAERKISVIRQFGIPPQKMEAQYMKLQGRSRSLTNSATNVPLRRSASFEAEDLLQQKKLETVSEDFANGGIYDQTMSAENDEVFAYIDKNFQNAKEFYEEKENEINFSSESQSEIFEDITDEASNKFVKDSSHYKNKCSYYLRDTSLFETANKENAKVDQFYQFSRFDSVNTKESFSLMDKKAESIPINELSKENPNKLPEDILPGASIDPTRQSDKAGVMVNSSYGKQSEIEINNGGKILSRSLEIEESSKLSDSFSFKAQLFKEMIGNVQECNNFISEEVIKTPRKSSSSLMEKFPSILKNLDDLCKQASVKPPYEGNIEFITNFGLSYSCEKIRNERRDFLRCSKNKFYSKRIKRHCQCFDRKKIDKLNSCKQKYIICNKFKCKCKHAFRKTTRSGSLTCEKDNLIFGRSNAAIATSDKLKMNELPKIKLKEIINKSDQDVYTKKESNIIIPSCNTDGITDDKNYVHHQEIFLRNRTEGKKLNLELKLLNNKFADEKFPLITAQPQLKTNDSWSCVSPAQNLNNEKQEKSADIVLKVCDFIPNPQTSEGEKCNLLQISENLNFLKKLSFEDDEQIKERNPASLEQQNYKHFSLHGGENKGVLIKNKIKKLQEMIIQDQNKIMSSWNPKTNSTSISGDVKTKLAFWENVNRKKEQKCQINAQGTDEFSEEIFEVHDEILNSRNLENFRGTVIRNTKKDDFLLSSDNTLDIQEKVNALKFDASNLTELTKDERNTDFNTLPGLKRSYSDSEIQNLEADIRILSTQSPLRELLNETSSVDNLSSSVDADLLESSIDDGLYSTDALVSTEDEYIDDEIPNNALLTHWGDLSLMKNLNTENTTDIKEFCQHIDSDFLKNQFQCAKSFPSECKVFGIATYYGYVAIKNRFKVLTKGAGNGNLSASVQGFGKHNVSLVNVRYMRKDIYEVTYQVMRPGLYLIFLRWMEKLIGGSPFLCKVTF